MSAMHYICFMCFNVKATYFVESFAVAKATHQVSSTTRIKQLYVIIIPLLNEPQLSCT